MKHREPVGFGQIDTNALDTPAVHLPTIPCNEPGCENWGDHMVIKPGESQYSFWCEEHTPKPPTLTPPAGQ